MKKEIFDKLVSRYEEWFVKNYWVYQSELLAVKSQMPDRGKGIEVGVGTGRFAKPLGIYKGVEPSVEMADLARQRGIEVFQARAEGLPFNDRSFDFVLMVTTVCFVDDVDASFAETHRVLKPGGQFIIGFVDKESGLGKTYERNKEKSLFYRHAKFYSTDDIRLHLQKAQFDHFIFKQTLFHKLDEVRHIEPVISGHGQGAFVVVRARKGI